MDTAEIFVTMGGLFLSVFVLWFFFGPRQAKKAGTTLGVQQIDVTVKGGYTPSRIEVEQGKPVRLIFHREESNPCTEQVILADFGISKILPQGQGVPLEFTPKQSGEFTFHCGMNMVRGQIIVKKS